VVSKEKFRAKAQFQRSSINHGLKAVVIDNEMFMDFSPKYGILLEPSIILIDN